MPLSQEKNICHPERSRGILPKDFGSIINVGVAQVEPTKKN